MPPKKDNNSSDTLVTHHMAYAQEHVKKINALLNKYKEIKSSENLICSLDREKRLLGEIVNYQRKIDPDKPSKYFLEWPKYDKRYDDDKRNTEINKRNLKALYFHYHRPHESEWNKDVCFTAATDKKMRLKVIFALNGEQEKELNDQFEKYWSEFTKIIQQINGSSTYVIKILDTMNLNHLFWDTAYTASLHEKLKDIKDDLQQIITKINKFNRFESHETGKKGFGDWNVIIPQVENDFFMQRDMVYLNNLLDQISLHTTNLRNKKQYVNKILRPKEKHESKRKGGRPPKTIIKQAGRVLVNYVIDCKYKDWKGSTDKSKLQEAILLIRPLLKELMKPFLEHNKIEISLDTRFYDVDINYYDFHKRYGKHLSKYLSKR